MTADHHRQSEGGRGQRRGPPLCPCDRRFRTLRGDPRCDPAPRRQCRRRKTRQDARLHRVCFRTRTTVLPDPRIQLHYGRLNIDALSPNTFLREMYTADFSTTEQIDGYEILSTEKNAKLLGSVMEVGEWSKRAKRLRWKTLLKKIDVPGRVTRMTLNNAMRPPVQFRLSGAVSAASIFCRSICALDGFVAFIDGLRKVALNRT